jgi:hypothetical protein
LGVAVGAGGRRTADLVGIIVFTMFSHHGPVGTWNASEPGSSVTKPTLATDETILRNRRNNLETDQAYQLAQQTAAKVAGRLR